MQLVCQRGDLISLILFVFLFKWTTHTQTHRKKEIILPGASVSLHPHRFRPESADVKRRPFPRAVFFLFWKFSTKQKQANEFCCSRFLFQLANPPAANSGYLFCLLFFLKLLVRTFFFAFNVRDAPAGCTSVSIKIIVGFSLRGEGQGRGGSQNEL